MPSPNRNSLWVQVPDQHKLRAGEVYQCDFGDLLPPEMVKIRPVIVLSRSALNMPRSTVLVVPTSSVAPAQIRPHHFALTTDLSPWKTPAVNGWAKCDMIYAVSRKRLSFIVRHGKRMTLRVSPEELLRLRLAASSALFGSPLGGGTSCPCVGVA